MKAKPTNARQATIKDLQRFASKFDITDECWVWNAQTVNGYGSFTFRGRLPKAHRFMYELIKGEVSTELELDHLCENKSCVNPDHLEPVTHIVNSQRGNLKRRREMCRAGLHPLSGDNLLSYEYPYKKMRTCKACGKLRHQKWYQRQKLENKEEV